MVYHLIFATEVYLAQFLKFIELLLLGGFFLGWWFFGVGLEFFVCFVCFWAWRTGDNSVYQSCWYYICKILVQQTSSSGFLVPSRPCHNPFRCHKSSYIAVWFFWCLSGPCCKVMLYPGTGLFFPVKRTCSWLDLSAVMVITCQGACFLVAFANKVCQGQILGASLLVPQVLRSL